MRVHPGLKVRKIPGLGKRTKIRSMKRGNLSSLPATKVRTPAFALVLLNYALPISFLALSPRITNTMTADQVANNLSPQIRDCFVTSDIRGLYVKFLLVGVKGRIHTRIDKV